ncbi:MAG TPA: EAL domain-containing protein [Stenotrophomonas sp.]|nr:EAL domain-containing protein [Stenotrophomonas sp.]
MSLASAVPLLQRPLAAIAAAAASGIGATLLWRRHTRSGKRGELDAAAAQALALIDEAVALLDAEDRVVDFNPAFLRLGGWPADVLRNAPFATLQAQDEDAPEALDANETWLRRADGQLLPCRVRRQTLAGPAARTLVCLRDIGESRRAERELRYLANYDTLTGLPLRARLAEDLAHALVGARRDGQTVALLAMDVDHLGHINDWLGHRAGDQALRATAERLAATIGGRGLLARLGGDEFAVVLCASDATRQAEQLAEEILRAFAEPLLLGSDQTTIVSLSLGIAEAPAHGRLPSELLAHAESATRRAKAAGRRTWRAYSAMLDRASHRRARIANALRAAEMDRSFHLVYQPRLALANGRMAAVEALLRWHDDAFGNISPDEFIPVAEQIGVMPEIGAWVLRKACATLADWRRQGVTDLRMSVNVSAWQLRQPDFAQQVTTLLAEHRLPPDRLELELTESAMLAEGERGIALLRELRSLGVAVAVDDFGTGYSSLSYLRQLPVTTLKIGQPFVADLAQGSGPIVAAIIDMGHALGLQVVAEGVEYARQRDFLLAHGCDEIQGYLVAPGRDAGACLALLQPAANARSLALAVP